MGLYPFQTLGRAYPGGLTAAGVAEETRKTPARGHEQPDSQESIEVRMKSIPAVAVAFFAVVVTACGSTSEDGTTGDDQNVTSRARIAGFNFDGPTVMARLP